MKDIKTSSLPQARHTPQEMRQYHSLSHQSLSSAHLITDLIQYQQEPIDGSYPSINYSLYGQWLSVSSLTEQGWGGLSTSWP